MTNYTGGIEMKENVVFLCRVHYSNISEPFVIFMFFILHIHIIEYICTLFSL